MIAALILLMAGGYVINRKKLQLREAANLPYYKIRMRIDYGNWTPEKAFETTENARLQMITYNNKTQHLQAWCDELGLNYKTVWIRIKRGWSVKDAFEKKVRCKGGVAE